MRIFFHLYHQFQPEREEKGFGVAGPVQVLTKWPKTGTLNLLYLGLCVFLRNLYTGEKDSVEWNSIETSNVIQDYILLWSWQRLLFILWSVKEGRNKNTQSQNTQIKTPCIPHPIRPPLFSNLASRQARSLYSFYKDENTINTVSRELEVIFIRAAESCVVITSR